MPREAEKSVVDGAPRSHHAPHAPSSLSWWRPQPRWLPAAAFGALLLSAAFGFWLRGAAAARRRRLDFPPPGKLDALIASAQDRLKAELGVKPTYGKLYKVGPDKVMEVSKKG